MADKVEGIVIRATDYGESNKVVILYTREFGKVGVMARGAKKPRNPLASCTQPLTYGNYLFSKGRGLGTLYQGDSINPFRYIKADLRKMAYASYIVDLIDKLADADARNPFLYELVLQLLMYMDEDVNPQVLSFIFEVKLMPVLGIEPVLDHCTHCGRQERLSDFSVSNGGLLCVYCRNMDSRSFPVSAATIKLLRLFKVIDMRRLGEIRLKPETIKELKTVLSAYYDAYSGLRLKSKQFIDQLETIDPS